MESVTRPAANIDGGQNGEKAKDRCGYFQMPLHYPRYTRAEYEAMQEWKPKNRQEVHEIQNIQKNQMYTALEWCALNL